MIPTIELHTFPSIFFFGLCCKEYKIRLEAFEHYQKGGYRNRYEIAGPNGRQTLSIPLMRGKNFRAPIKEVSISYDEDWPTQHWRSLQTAYGNSPFFIHYKDNIKELLFCQENNLWTWNLNALRMVSSLLGLEIEIIETQVFKKLIEKNDYRNTILPSKEKEVLLPEYPQVFQEKSGYLTNLSILDLLFCMGPMAHEYLEKIEPSLSFDT